MKIGWLVWRYEEDEEPRFFSDESFDGWGFKVVQIVYCEVIK